MWESCGNKHLHCPINVILQSDVCAPIGTRSPLIQEVREKLPVEPGRPERWEHEYVRCGVAQVFLEVEPLTGRRYVEVGERRTRRDWARLDSGYAAHPIPAGGAGRVDPGQPQHPRNRIAV